MKAILGVVFLTALCGCRSRAPATGEGNPDVASPGGPVRVLYPAAPGAFVDLVEKLSASVVHLESTTEVTGGPATLFRDAPSDRALGTGFAVRVGSRTLVLTNDHVVAPALEIHAVLRDGTKLSAKMVGRDAKLDVALLELDKAPALVPARLGKSSSLRTGEWVLALGNPFGNEVTASAGIVSSVGASEGDLVRRKKVSPFALIQADVAIHAGNSGGPLVNMAGEVVGINTALDFRSQSVGLALPIDRARDVLPVLSEHGLVTRAWLGMKILPVDTETRTSLSLEPGVGALISDIVAGGPAARAGLKRGDLIVRYDGAPVNHKSLPWKVSRSSFQTKQLTLYRGGEKRELLVAPEKMPE